MEYSLSVNVTNTNRVELKANYYDKIYSKPYPTKRFDAIYDQICDWVKETPIPRILEVGCGTGILGSRLFNICEDRNEAVYNGFDFSETALDSCPEMIQDVIFVNNAYNEKVWKQYFRKQDYNIVVSVEVFEHLNDIRVLDMIPLGTRIIFSVPDFDSKPHLRTYPSINAIKKYYEYVLKIDKYIKINNPLNTKSIFVCDSEKI